MPWIAAVGAVVGGIGGALISSDSGEDAANAQYGAAQLGVGEQRRQFNAIQELLRPFVSGGPMALTGQQDLLGLNGGSRQQTSIDAIKDSPQFTSLLKSGEEAILSNASATGGLRGGNTERALMEFSPTLLNSLIDQQYGRLGGLTTLGQNSAVMQANAGQNSANNITGLLQQMGAAQAGAALAGGQAGVNAINGASSGLGFYAAYRSRPPPPSNNYGYTDGSSVVPGF